MFDLGSGAAPTVDDVRGAVLALTRIGEGADDPAEDAARIDLLRALEELKGAAEGAQAVLAAAFDRSQHDVEAAAGVPAGRRGRGVAAQVGWARRESPHRGRQHVGMALVLRDQMPCTGRALRWGRISEWRALLLVRETACLSPRDRAEVDRRVAVTSTWWRRWGTGSWSPRPGSWPTSWPRRRSWRVVPVRRPTGG